MTKIVAAALLVCMLAGAAWAEPVKGIVITTDRSVNCATLETIVKDITAVIDVGGTKRPKMKSVTITCPAAKE
jgi:hypothetical protein